MAKRERCVYSKIYDFENLYTAYRMAARAKRYKADVLAFTEHLEENLIQLQNELIYRTYTVGRYHEFFVHDPKKRLIMALPFRDRVVQWAVFRIIEPPVDRRMISDSYACRTGKGSHAAVRQLQRWIRGLSSRGVTVYALKMDVAKFFYRIDHGVLMNVLRQVVACPDTLWLLETIIRCEDTDFGISLGDHSFALGRLRGIGIPIGNLTSQLFANFYLDQLDQFAKHTLRLKKYIRYMDDVVVLSVDKQALGRAQWEMTDFLRNQLHLEVNAKTGVQLAAGLEFCGFRIWPGRIKVRRSTVRRMKRHLGYLKKRYAASGIDVAKINATIQSYAGHLGHCDSQGLRRTLFEGLTFRRNKRIER